MEPNLVAEELVVVLIDRITLTPSVPAHALIRDLVCQVARIYHDVRLIPAYSRMLHS